MRRKLACFLGLAAMLAASTSVIPGAARAEGLGFASFWAIVAADGKTVGGSGVQSSSNPVVGAYIVQFTRKVKNCAFIATPRGTVGGQVSVQPVARGGKGQKVKVVTFDKAGAKTNRAFTLSVSCV